MSLLAAPLTSSGAQIHDANGNSVRLAGVNWGGAQQDNMTVAGLDKLHRDEISERIAGWGMNHVRLPFSVGTFMTNSGALKTGPVPEPGSLAANPDLAGMSPWEVYQAVVESLTDHGLAVIPNQQLLYPGWCCSANDCNGLWWNGSWPASTWTSCWQLVADEFAANQLVIGYDLHNEPHPASIGGTVYTPSWGDNNPQTDMRQLYAETIPILRAAGGTKLFFCEGLNFAADLTEAAAHPVGTGAGTIYSLHDYSSYSHPPGQTQQEYFSQMDAAGGYLQVDNEAPLYLGEFGVDLGYRANFNSGWMANLLDYIAARNLHWCWWELSAQMVKGTQPCTNILEWNDGDREPFGLMAGQDWLGDQTEMLALLQAVMG